MNQNLGINNTSYLPHTHLGASPSPVYSRRRATFGIRSSHHRLAVDPVDSPPSGAAPAAGGRGIAGSVYIGSVGVRCVAAGAAMEEVVAPVVLLQVEVFLCGGGAPRSSDVALLPLPRSQLCGAAVRGLPFAGCRETADLASTTFVQAAGEVWFDDGDVRWRRSSAAGDRRLPVRSGVLSIQGVLESKSGGAPPTASWTKTESSCSRVWSVISIFLWTFL